MCCFVVAQCSEVDEPLRCSGEAIRYSHMGRQHLYEAAWKLPHPAGLGDLPLEEASLRSHAIHVGLMAGGALKVSGWLHQEFAPLQQRAIKQTDCVNLGTRIVTPSFKPASLNPKAASYQIKAHFLSMLEKHLHYKYDLFLTQSVNGLFISYSTKTILSTPSILFCLNFGPHFRRSDMLLPHNAESD